MSKAIQYKDNGENVYPVALERVENSNGTALKFADGTLIQYGIIDKTLFLNTSTLSITVQGIRWFRSAVPSISFPIPFKSINYSISFGVRSDYQGSRVYMCRLNGKALGSFNPQLTSIEDFLEDTGGYKNLMHVTWQAIGRWK